MNDQIQTIDQETLFGRAIPSLSDEQAGQLISPITEQIKAKLSTKKLTVTEKAHLKATIHWLQNHQLLDSSLEEQIQGYLEACDHLCKIELWPVAYQIFSLRLPFLPDYIFYENLGIWGYYREQIEIGKKLIEKISNDVDFLCLFEMGNAYCYLGQYETAFNYYYRLLCLATKQNNLIAICQAFRGLGGNYCQQGEIDLAIEYFQKQLKLSQKIQASSEEIQALLELSHCHDMSGNHKKSIFYLNQAVIFEFEKIDDLRVKTLVLLNIGSSFAMLKQYQKAIKYLEISLKFSRIIYSKPLELESLAGLGISQAMSINTGQRIEIEKAIKNIYQALQFTEQVGDLFLEMAISNNLAVIYYWKLKDHQKSIFYLQKALKLSYFLNNPIAQCYILAHIAYHYSCLKNHTLSFQYVDQALDLAQEIHNKPALAIVFAMRANTYWLTGNYLKAMILLIRSLIILPPWKTTNGQLIWQRFVELLKLKITGEQA